MGKDIVEILEKGSVVFLKQAILEQKNQNYYKKLSLTVLNFLTYRVAIS